MDGQIIESYISLTEAAEILGISRQATHRRIQKGRLVAAKLGKRWVLPRWTVLRSVSETDKETKAQVKH